MTKLVLLRHGQSIWNLENRFTGWTDVDLSEQGLAEAHQAGQQLAELGIHFDIAFTSLLKRAIRTLWLVLDEMDLMWLPVTRAWELNERHYGALQGLNKAETAQKAGPEQVHLWRRSFDVRPPALDWDDPRHPHHDPRYAALTAAQLPATESLQDTPKRVLALMTPLELGGWAGDDAKSMRRAFRLYPQRIVLLDWVRYSRNHGEWFQPDGTHLTFSGANAFASLARRATPWARHGEMPDHNFFPKAGH